MLFARLFGEKLAGTTKSTMELSYTKIKYNSPRYEVDYVIFRQDVRLVREQNFPSYSNDMKFHSKLKKNHPIARLTTHSEQYR